MGAGTMSEPQSPVFMFSASDPEMQRANERARSTFKYFWREMSWERRRIIPACSMAAVKAPFADDGDLSSDAVEHMWLSEIDFDGKVITGELMNSPNNLKSVKQGDKVSMPLSQISDWMMVLVGDVYGGFTVNLMRSRMSGTERRAHDQAWGLNFGDPSNIRIKQEPKQKKILGIPIGKPAPTSGDEHPMSEPMAGKLKEQLAEDPSLIPWRDDDGWGFLHQEALAGNLASVKVLLEAGADPDARTNHGMTPLELANCLGWTEVTALLSGR